MTVIAWDGKMIAADRQLTMSYARRTTTKLHRLASGEIAAFSGEHAVGKILVKWYEDGASVATWPAVQSTDDWSRLIILGSDGLKYYEKQPIALFVEDPFTAFGSGFEFALGAMAMGADARRAVEIASQFSTGCGMGCDTMMFDSTALVFGTSVPERIRRSVQANAST